MKTFWKVLIRLTLLSIILDKETVFCDRAKQLIITNSTFIEKAIKRNGSLVLQAQGKSDSYWTNPGGVTVCWETSGWEREKELVKQAIAETWERHSALRFVGWDDCGWESSDIRIVIEDGHPHVKTLGNKLKNRRNGMLLNFEYRKFSSSYCQTRKEHCNRGIAVHEFGHAIGLAHEQNRPDAPSWCRDRFQTEKVQDHLITTYDPESVMNYCTEPYNNDGELSALDKQAVQLIYPSVKSCKAYEFRCGNGRCIPLEYECDGDNDCGNGADESPRNSRCTKMTCGGKVIGLLPAGTSSQTVRCCGKNAMNPDTEWCCGTIVRPKEENCDTNHNISTNLLCGGVPIITLPLGTTDSTVMCCGTTAINEDTHGCCGTEAVALDNWSCNQGQGEQKSVVNRYANVVNSIGKGCDVGTRVKCGGVAVNLLPLGATDETVQCCGTTAFNPLTQSCCSQTVVPLANGLDHYQSEESRCCNRVLSINMEQSLCCKNGIVDIWEKCPEENIICNGVTSPLPNGLSVKNSKCCETTPFDPTKHSCCSMSVVPLANGLSYSNSSNSRCCNGASMNLKTSVCCDRGPVLGKFC